MGDTRTLLNRISSFRQRLEEMPSLVPAKQLALDHSQLAQNPELIARSLRTLGAPEPVEPPLPGQLTARAIQLLEEARGLIQHQRQLTDDALLRSPLLPEDDVLHVYCRQTVALTDATLRMVQAFPTSATGQLRLCDGVEAMLKAVRDRLAVTQRALNNRRRDLDRIDQLARRLTNLSMGRAVDFQWFVELGEQLISEAKQASAIRFLSVDPMSSQSDGEAEPIAAPARFIAAHALTTAQVLARIVNQDFEWAGRPMVPIVAALLLNIGMLRVSGATLASTQPLQPLERRQIDDHAEIGADIIRNMFPDAGLIAAAVSAHHERPDGSGYPNGLKTESIPSLAKLLSVADYYAALNCDRPHRAALDPRTALTETLMAAEQGKLDRDFCEYLLQLTFHPVGTVVELTDGRIGVVAATHMSRVNLRASTRPVVAVLVTAKGEVMPRPDFVDLANAEIGGVIRALPKAERTRILAKDYPELC
jgi:HD-GYP domain-containing protein (c-di-GMP phosphodiesterase class II)